MRRKPAIILFSLLLLLSIGGAVFQHQLRKEQPPDFAEVDSFLRNVPPSSKWEFFSNFAMQDLRVKRSSWWNRLGIRREDHIETDLYQIRRIRSDDALLMPGIGGEDPIGKAIHPSDKDRDDDAALVEISRTNGKIQRVRIQDSTAFREIIVRKFPKLQRYEAKPSTP